MRWVGQLADLAPHRNVFENFVLRLDYRPLYGAESGVFLHAPLYGRIAHVGFDVRLGGAGGLRRHSAGAIFDAVPPLVAASRPWGAPDFNQLEITMNWPKLSVRLNGQLVQDLNVEEHQSLRYRPRLGFIGLQDRGKPVLFRNIRVKRLPDQVRDQWPNQLTKWSERNGPSNRADSAVPQRGERVCRHHRTSAARAFPASHLGH